jgi:hypothetical protein
VFSFLFDWKCALSESKKSLKVSAQNGAPTVIAQCLRHETLYLSGRYPSRQQPASRQLNRTYLNP